MYLPSFDIGGVDENAVLKTSSLSVKRKRSRKSHADVCLIRPGRVASGNFFDVLNVARAGLIGVVVDGVRNFDADTGAVFTFLVIFGVFLVDILLINFILLVFFE